MRNRRWGLPDPDFDWPSMPRVLPGKGTSLAELIATTAAKTFTYVYDFGDDWEHKVKLEKTCEPAPGAAYPLLSHAAAASAHRRRTSSSPAPPARCHAAAARSCRLPGDDCTVVRNSLGWAAAGGTVSSKARATARETRCACKAQPSTVQSVIRAARSGSQPRLLHWTFRPHVLVLVL